MKPSHISILFLALVVFALSVNAQEPVEPLPTDVEPTITVPTETSIPIMTDTVIPSPSFTYTETSLFTETSTSTSTPTLETFLPTGSPEFTVTSSPTLLPQPTFDAFAAPQPPFTTQLYDNFNGGALAIWRIGAGWRLIASEDGQALQTITTTEPVILGDEAIYNVSVQMRVRVDAGAIRLFLRQNGSAEYAISLDREGNINLYKGTTVLSSAVLPAAQAGQWRTLRFSVVESVLRVWIDTTEVIFSIDEAPLTGGYVGFNSSGEIGVNVTVDDVVVAWQSVNALISTLPPLAWDEQPGSTERFMWQLEEGGSRDTLFGTSPLYATGNVGNAILVVHQEDS